jgi:tight adherence protein B
MNLDFFFFNVLGKSGVLGVIGIITFITTYKHSVPVFDWIEKQTVGNREYLLKKLDLMFIKIDPMKLTYGLWFCSFGLGIILFGIVAILVGNFYVAILLGILVSFIGWKIPKPLVEFFYERRLKKFQVQMVDALNLLSGGLRAGLSLQQASGLVTSELPNPVSEEFNLILQQNRLGIPIDECFKNLYERVPTEDNQMFVTCISILRETGGNLAEIFDTIAATIRERVRLSQKIDSATAQGRTQGIIIFFMPFAMFVVNWVNNPESTSVMLTKPMGIVLISLAMLMTFVGGYLMYRIVKIKV